MSELSSVLVAQKEAIVGALAEKLPRAGCAAIAEAAAAAPGAILEALKECCLSGGKAAREWLAGLREEISPRAVGPGEVLAYVHCVERVLRYYVVRELTQKKVLVPALAELSDVTELFRIGALELGAEPAEAIADESADHDFRALAEKAGLFVCVASLQGKPFYLNPAGRRMIGLADDEAIPEQGLHGFYSDESWSELREVAVPAVQSRGHWEGHSRLRNPRTGESTEVTSTLFVIRQPGSRTPRYLAILHQPTLDVGEALAEAEARKNSIFESSLDPIITIDDQGVIIEFNRAAEQVFGHPRGKVLGTKPAEVLFPPTASAGEEDRIERYLDAGEGSMLGRRVEVTAVRADGETFPAEMAMTISQERGAPVLSFFIRDISERKKAELARARYAAELERSNQELQQFAYVASHDLQEPLRKICTFGDRLQSKAGDKLDEDGRQCVERMQNAAVRMQSLIEGLLSLSRVATREQRFKAVDLGQVVREVVTDLEMQIERVEGRVEVGKLPTIQADPLQMRQLLQNLIGNALKFHRDEEPPLVKVSGRFLGGREEAGEHRRPARDERCRIVIEDNGIGFDEKHRERIFGVFQRLHPRDVYEGTGIGLAVCRRIVERHGGTISAQSKPDHGTTFEIVLPVMQPRSKRD